MKPVDLDAIDARAASASPGPWLWWTSCGWRRLVGDLARRGQRDGYVLLPIIAKDGQPDILVSAGDQAFIEHAIEDITAMSAELRAARQDVIVARERIDDLTERLRIALAAVEKPNGE